MNFDFEISRVDCLPFCFSCNCTEDWKGLFCTEKVTVCDMQHACADGATCLPRVTGGYECLCPLGRKGENCTEGSVIMQLSPITHHKPFFLT